MKNYPSGTATQDCPLTNSTSLNVINDDQHILIMLICIFFSFILYPCICFYSESNIGPSVCTITAVFKAVI